MAKVHIIDHEEECDQKMLPWLLSFVNKELEQKYQDQWTRKYLKTIRFIMLFGSVVFGLATPLPSSWIFTALLLVFTLTLFATFLSTFTTKGKKMLSIILTICLTLIFITFVLINAQGSGEHTTRDYIIFRETGVCGDGRQGNIASLNLTDTCFTGKDIMNEIRYLNKIIISLLWLATWVTTGNISIFIFGLPFKNTMISIIMPGICFIYVAMYYVDGPWIGRILLLYVAGFVIIICCSYNFEKKNRQLFRELEKQKNIIEKQATDIILRNKEIKKGKLEIESLEVRYEKATQDEERNIELIFHGLKVEGIKSIKFKDLENIERLGQGSFGQVISAQWTPNGNVDEKMKVAVKYVLRSHLDNKEAVHRVITEIRMLARISHPYVCNFYGCTWDKPPNLGLVMEYMPGGSLKWFLKSAKTNDFGKEALSWNHTLLGFVENIVSGLCYFHRGFLSSQEEFDYQLKHNTFKPKPCIHRDIKSDNVLVKQVGNMKWLAKIADLGESRFKADDEERTMTLVGTPNYIAPEVGIGDQYSEKADIFSFGILLNEIDTLQKPYYSFKSGRQVFITNLVFTGKMRPEISPFCLPAIAALCRECWAQNPEERPRAIDIEKRLQGVVRNQFNWVNDVLKALLTRKLSTFEDLVDVMTDTEANIMLTEDTKQSISILYEVEGFSSEMMEKILKGYLHSGSYTNKLSLEKKLALILENVVTNLCEGERSTIGTTTTTEKLICIIDDPTPKAGEDQTKRKIWDPQQDHLISE